MILGIIINLILSLWIIPEYLGSKRKIGYTWSLIACLFLTPLIGVIITLLSPKLEEYKKEAKAVQREQSKIDDSFHNLFELKQKGILTDEEYNQKVSKINAEKTEQELKNSVGYKQLKSLLDSNILTKEEFESKVRLLKNNPKDIEESGLKKYDIVGLYKNSDSTFVFNARGGCNIEAPNLKVSGKWKIDTNGILITTKTNTKKIEVLSITPKKLSVLFKGQTYNLIKR